jgi:hypothetical protein
MWYDITMTDLTGVAVQDIAIAELALHELQGRRISARHYLFGDFPFAAPAAAARIAHRTHSSASSRTSAGTS